jgi:hypothetical protein
VKRPAIPPVGDESRDQLMAAADQLSKAIYAVEIKQRKRKVSKIAIREEVSRNFTLKKIFQGEIFSSG